MEDDEDYMDESIFDVTYVEREETVWDIAMALVDYLYQLTHDEELCEIYKDRLEAAYRKEAEGIQKRINDELDYFCGRHTFFPFEC